MSLIKNDDGTVTCSKCNAVYDKYIKFDDIIERISTGERCTVCTGLLWNWRELK